MALAEGDQEKARYRYITLRVEQRSRSKSLWSVFTHPVYGQKVVKYTNRKNGVAFFFCPIWHIVTRTRHGLWLLVARVVLALLGAGAIAGRLAEGGYSAEEDAAWASAIFLLFDIAVAFIWLFKANTFRHKSLEARGYKQVDIIEGRTKDDVLAKLTSTS